MKTRSYIRHRAAFSLIELLVVITIMLLLITLGSSMLQTNIGPQGAAIVASGYFDEARSQAIMRQTIACVLIDTDPTEATKGTQDYLRRSVVAYLNNNDFVQCTTWSYLPGNVYYNPQYIVSHGKLDAVTLPNGQMPTFNKGAAPAYDCYMFLPNGQAYYQNGTYSAQLPQLIVCNGDVDSKGNFSVHGQNSLYGFGLSRMGREIFFQNLSDIKP